MSRCATCRHWTPFGAVENDTHYADDDLLREDIIYEVARGRRTLRVLIAERRLGLCRKANGLVENLDLESLAYAEDGSDYIANFRTAAEFGCVMHEGKVET